MYKLIHSYATAKKLTKILSSITEPWIPSSKEISSSIKQKTFRCLIRSLEINELLRRVNQPAVELVFRWFLCSGANLSVCLTSTSFPLDKSSFQIRKDGTLFWPRINVKKLQVCSFYFYLFRIMQSLCANLSSQQGKRLLCLLFGTPLAFYPPFTELDSRTEVQKMSLNVVQPRGSEEFILFNSTDWRLTLPCSFNSSAVHVKVQWMVARESGSKMLFNGWNKEQRVRSRLYTS